VVSAVPARPAIHTVALTWYFSSMELRGFELLTLSMPWSFVLLVSRV